MLNNKSGFALIAFSSTSIILLGGLIAFFGISLQWIIDELNTVINPCLHDGIYDPSTIVRTGLVSWGFKSPHVIVKTLEACLLVIIANNIIVAMVVD